VLVKPVPWPAAPETADDDEVVQMKVLRTSVLCRRHPARLSPSSACQRHDRAPRRLSPGRSTAPLNIVIHSRELLPRIPEQELRRPHIYPAIQKRNGTPAGGANHRTQAGQPYRPRSTHPLSTPFNCGTPQLNTKA
jgi:hypothetical protein